MKRYVVTAPMGITLYPGQVLVPTGPAQAERIAPYVTVDRRKRQATVDRPVAFKRGEEIILPGELPKAMLTEVADAALEARLRAEEEEAAAEARRREAEEEAARLAAAVQAASQTLQPPQLEPHIAGGPIGTADQITAAKAQADTGAAADANGKAGAPEPDAAATGPKTLV